MHCLGYVVVHYLMCTAVMIIFTMVLFSVLSITLLKDNCDVSILREAKKEKDRKVSKRKSQRIIEEEGMKTENASKTS